MLRVRRKTSFTGKWPQVTPCKIQDAYILKYILPKAQAPHQAPPHANLPICQSQTLAEEGKGSTI